MPLCAVAKRYRTLRAVPGGRVLWPTQQKYPRITRSRVAFGLQSDAKNPSTLASRCFPYSRLQALEGEKVPFPTEGTSPPSG